ncbi:MAG TPA: TetR/AcrR family transcriptional regulator [Candidatus Acidoferrum sp.]|nr:TetR/AcrR family transcriptional regulator [Candidatus Acidoferrum sp.]
MGKGEDTRRRIIERAAALFNQRGFEGTALSDLMEATKLRKGGIYRHFDSKEELATEAFDYAWEAARQARHEGLSEIPNAVERLKGFVKNFVEVRPPVPGGCPLMNTAIEADDGNIVLRAHAREALRSWREFIEATVAAGKERGEIRVKAHGEETATMLIAGLEGALMMSRLAHSDQPLRTMQIHLNEYLEKNLRKSEPASS